MIKLDKSKPFGEIHGAEDRAMFEQQGIRFDFNGFPVGENIPLPVGVKAEEVEEESAESQSDIILRMSKEGKSYSEIAKAVGVHHLTVKAILKRIG